MSKRLSKTLRLRTPKEFQHHFKQIRKKSTSLYFSLLTRPNSLAVPRLGISISKKKVALAVDRNRLKRIIRESFREHQQELEGLDVVVIAQKDCDKVSNEKIFLKLEQQWQELVRFYRKSLLE